MATRGQFRDSYPSQQVNQTKEFPPNDEDLCTLPEGNKVEQNSFSYDGGSKQQPSSTSATYSYRGDMPGAKNSTSSTGSEREKISQSITSEELMDWNKIHKWGLMTRTIAHYQRLEQVGEGTYGQVYKAKCINTGRDVALKKIRVHHGGYKGLPTTAIREIKIMKQLQHKNMVELIEVLTSKGVEYLDEEDCRDDEKRNRERESEKDKKTSVSDHDSLVIDRSPTKNPKKDKLSDKNMDPREGFKGNLFLVLEYVSHDLTGLMDMCFRFTEVQVKCIFRQLLDVLDYIHTNNYVHRDLKCSNILLTSSFQLKLADFGLARCLDASSFLFDNNSDETDLALQDLTNKVITLWYRPPELLLGETRYGTSVDIWSAGCILAELLLGRPIFTGKTEMEQLSLIFDLVGTPTENKWEGYSNLKLIKTGAVAVGKSRSSTLRQKYGSKNKMSSTAIDLLEKLLELDPTKRITAGRALTSRYFLTEPRAPENPEELGLVDLGTSGGDGHFHEFQTKKRRREAKAVAEKARKETKEKGCTEKEAEAAYSVAYEEHILKMARDRPENNTSLKKPSRLPKNDVEKDVETVEKCNEVKREHQESKQSSRTDPNLSLSSEKSEADNKDSERNKGKGAGNEKHRNISQEPRQVVAEKIPTPLSDIDRRGKEGNGATENLCQGHKGRREISGAPADETHRLHDTDRRRASSSQLVMPKEIENSSRDVRMRGQLHEREKTSEERAQDSKSKVVSSNRSDFVHREKTRSDTRERHINKPDREMQNDKNKSKRARSSSRSSSSSSYSSSYSSSTSSESSLSNHRRRSSRSRKRHRGTSCSPERGSRRSSEKRKEREKDHSSRRKISKAAVRSSGLHREWGRERERKSQGGDERSHHERSTQRHRHVEDRVREQTRPHNTGYENWNEEDRLRGKDQRDRTYFHEVKRDEHLSHGSFGGYSDVPPRNWIEPAYAQEKAPSSDRRHRYSDRHRDAVDSNRSHIDLQRRGSREHRGNPERGNRW